MSSTQSYKRDPPPRWNMNSLYPSAGKKPALESPAFLEAKKEFQESVAIFRDHVQDESARNTSPGTWLSTAIRQLNQLRGLHVSLYAFAYALYSTATTETGPMREMGKLDEAALPLHRIESLFRNALKDLEPLIPDLLSGDPGLADYRLFIEEELYAQGHQMSPEMEDLAADLNRSGGDAWSRLQSTLASTLSAPWEHETTSEKWERRTVVELRALAFSPEREIRHKAFQLELEVWKSMEIPLSYALNGVKGHSTTLNRRRDYGSPLELSLRQSRISAPTLDALIGAMEESLPLFRRYLKAKAKLLGLEKLAFYDLFAPCPSPAGTEKRKRTWRFDETREFILKHFASFAPDLAAFAREAFDKGWIDAEPRSGKVGGAYCISFPDQRESRILTNFSGTARDVSTLAHELGHGYHHHLVRTLPPLHQEYPMTLAETASIFAETLISDKALAALKGTERLEIIEGSLQDSTQVIVDILSRFYFEQEVMERRHDHELSPGELCSLMRESQLKTYGEALDAEALHPYMWAVKGHYYRPDLAFYNYPYAFGLLFGIALYGRYLESPEGFAAEYRELLAGTGKTHAVELARQSGFDIESRDFWRSGLEVIRRQVEEFERGVGE